MHNFFRLIFLMSSYLFIRPTITGSPICLPSGAECTYDGSLGFCCSGQCVQLRPEVTGYCAFQKTARKIGAKRKNIAQEDKVVTPSPAPATTQDPAPVPDPLPGPGPAGGNMIDKFKRFFGNSLSKLRRPN